jgi:protein dithiol oxidoreductase (disulfide-forming)
MNRGIVIGSVLAVAALAATISFRACAATPERPADGSIRLAAAPAAAPAAGASSMSQWQAGVNYTVLGYPLPPSLPKGKVEVSEVFWYGCSHCYHLDPYLETWKQSKPAFVEFVRIPVVWGPSQKQHARLFYTLRKLDRDDLHTKVFDAIHKDGKLMMAQTDDAARALQLAFLKENGVTEQQFNAAYDSPEVAKNVDLAERLTARYEVASVPTMIVQGAYSTSVSQAGGEKQLLTLINDLAAREQRR